MTQALMRHNKCVFGAWNISHFHILLYRKTSAPLCVCACVRVRSLQRSARPSKCLTAMGMGSSQSKSWGWPCAPWATCQTRWSWRSSSRDWTWTVRQHRHGVDYVLLNHKSQRPFALCLPTKTGLWAGKTSGNKHRLFLLFSPRRRWPGGL